ncbi:GNAT family N-acetyltransferase [Actinacidiphila yeochonensis]|uniref:GNAT family N-acetyltransferase n=1 Tax=Actinacidiphila yeochonensis TaxID=89050 RepID=UPI00056928A7|nr:GNAT family N-acetyltransferase [Actinacidiphila yeochonensis]
MSITVRSAERADVPALVRLRLANAEAHVRLAPDLYRIPEADTVRRHFEGLLADGPSVLITVAELAGEVVGMSEVVLLPEPPDHQILQPRRGADLHTVVLETHRGQGVGRALVAAAERIASAHGAAFLHAGIFTPNADALAFYSASGFGPRGTLLTKERATP